MSIVTCPQCPAKRTRRSAGAAAVRRTKRLEERCHVIEERILPRLKDKNEGKAQYYRAQLSAIRWALKELERLTAERDAARAAARELWQALERVMPMGMDAAHEHFSDMEGKEDTRTEALWNASNALAKHADLVKGAA